MLKTKFYPFPHLTTERLSIRKMEKEDAIDILKLRSDERVNKYIDRKPMQSIEDAANFIDMINTNNESGVSLYWAIGDKQTKQLLGTVCIWNIVEADFKAELGYELMYDAWGKGYMQECISKVLDFAFKEIGLKVIEAVIVEGNDRSIKLAEKNDFVFSRKEDVCLIFILTR